VRGAETIDRLHFGSDPDNYPDPGICKGSLSPDLFVRKLWNSDV